MTILYPFRQLMLFGSLEWNGKMICKHCVVYVDGVMSIALSQLRTGTYQRHSAHGVCHPKAVGREGGIVIRDGGPIRALPE
jgi:hypothetical protein